MQWDDSRNAGFSTAAPENLYLPMDPDEQRPTVIQQHNDPDSLLHCVRALSKIRHSHTALQASSEFEVLFAQPGVCPLVYLRSNENESLIVAINPSSKPVETRIPAISFNLPQTLHGFEDAIRIGGIIGKSVAWYIGWIICLGDNQHVLC
jgi:maltose alpha-D-glucosyltransferase/alpha-amylase